MERSSNSAVKDEPKGVPAYEEQEEPISRRPSVDGSADSPTYSDAEDQSWHSQYTSNGGTYDDEYDYSNASDPDIAGMSDLARRSLSDSSDVDLEKGPDPEVKAPEGNAPSDQGRQLDRIESRSEKECRICHLTLETNQEAGASIVLGCSCKDDLAAAHKQCAEAWFKIRGNRLAFFPCDHLFFKYLYSDFLLAIKLWTQMHSLTLCAPIPLVVGFILHSYDQGTCFSFRFCSCTRSRLDTKLVHY